MVGVCGWWHLLVQEQWLACHHWTDIVVDKVGLWSQELVLLLTLAGTLLAAHAVHAVNHPVRPKWLEDAPHVGMPNKAPGAETLEMASTGLEALELEDGTPGRSAEAGAGETGYANLQSLKTLAETLQQDTAMQALHDAVQNHIAEEYARFGRAPASVPSGVDLTDGVVGHHLVSCQPHTLCLAFEGMR